jgi:hypothetical protein
MDGLIVLNKRYKHVQEERGFVCIDLVLILVRILAIH